jgi:putative dehydrogenase
MAGAVDGGPKVAVIGLGSMGMGIASSLIGAGFSVTGCDIDPARVEFLKGEGGSADIRPAVAAKGADVLVTVVVNAAQTEAVLFGADGCLSELAGKAVVISCATMAPEAARSIAGKVEATGRLYLDAPISGGSKRAASGDLTVLASGSAEAFREARPVLSAIAAKVYELGDVPGIGASFKMVNQLLAGVHIAAACEAVAFAARQGLDLAKVYEVITAAAGNSWMFENRVPHILSGDYSPQSAVSIFTKDLGILLDMARSDSFPLPVTGAALQMFLMAAAAGMARDDDASVVRVYERLTGIPLPIGK